MTCRPHVRPAGPWNFPSPVEHRLANGLTVEIYSLPGQYVTSTRILMPVPAAAEPRAHEGVATIVSRTMDEGTRSHSAEELAELFEQNGIGLSGGMTARGLILELESVRGQLRTGWNLARECVTEPVFPADEVDRHVRQRLSELEHELADGSARASLEWVKTFYDPACRASRPLAGEGTTLPTIDTAACAAFHSAHVRADQAHVVVAGDVDATEVIAGLEETLGQWSTDRVGAASDPVIPEALAADRGRVVFVDRPGSVQTAIHVGWQGPSRRVEGGWAPYPVLSFVLGGSPNARIDAVLREEKGYTYGMRAGFRPRVNDGVFSASGSVRADATGPALDLLLQILRDADNGFQDKEIREAVDFIAKTAPGRYSTADAIADEAALLHFDGLRASDFVTDYLAGLQQVTPDSAVEAWQRFSSQTPTVVLVGDAEQQADAVRGLGLTLDVLSA